jgi:hypothetical protein
MPEKRQKMEFCHAKLKQCEAAIAESNYLHLPPRHIIHAKHVFI